jgi:pectate lyase-like protein
MPTPYSGALTHTLNEYASLKGGVVLDAKTDFGAIGDGTTDDTAAIQAAIAAVAAGKTTGEVRIPSGTYLVGQINMVAGIKLRCESGVIFLANAPDVTVFFFGDKVSHSGIIGGGCSIWGNGHAGVTGISISPADEAHASQYNTFNDIVIGKPADGGQAVANGVDAQWSFVNTFTSVTVPLPRVSAFVFAVAANSCTLINCSSIAVFGAGITAQTNANPAVLTAQEDLAPGEVTISGYTGSWAAANGVWTVTLLGGKLFSIPLNSTGLGAATGTPIYLFSSIPIGIQSNNNGNFTAIGCTIEGTMTNVVYQADCVTFLNCYFEDSGATVPGVWVTVGTATGTQTSCVSFIGCIFNEGVAYALDVFQVHGLVVRGCSFNPQTQSACFRVWNNAYNSDKKGWDVGGNDFNGVTPFFIVNAVSPDLSSNISQDVVTPLKFTGPFAHGSPFVPPDASMSPGDGTLYINPNNGLLLYNFQDTSLDDITSAGAFTGSAAATYTIQITAAGTPDTIQWQKNGGSWTAGVALTGSAQTMSDGVQFIAAATTGHTVGTIWNIRASGGNVIASSSNTSPAAQLLDASGDGLPSGSNFQTVVSGYTGSWAAVNGTWTATALTARIFTVPVDSSAFGPSAGSPVFTFIRPAIKQAIVGTSVGGDRYYFGPFASAADSNHSLAYSSSSDGVDGAALKGWGGVRLLRAQSGGSERNQSIVQAGGFNGSTYFSNILLGNANVLPQTGGTVEVCDLISNATALDVIGGSAQGVTSLLRIWNFISGLVAEVRADGTAKFTNVDNTVEHTAGALTAGQLIIGNGSVASGTNVADVKPGDLTGDVTTSGTTATTLKASGVTAGSYTSADITVNAKGIVTNISSGGGTSGFTGTITTAKLTTGGTNGSMTFLNGVLTSQTAAT